MNMLVCVKQVPDTTEIKIDPVTNTLIRDGVPSILNPYDGYALEAAARVRDKNPDAKIVVLSMGPEQAKNALKDALAIAADKAYLVSGRPFGGSDTLATSYIISEAIKKIEEIEGKFDVIFCGKQAIDGDTAQVGPEIAEHLGYPQVTYGLECELVGDKMRVKKEVEDGVQVVDIGMPCVLTFTKPAWVPRLPNIKRKMAAMRAVIDVLTENDIPGIDLGQAGLKGSPTKVKSTFVPVKKKSGVKLEGLEVEDAAKQLYGMLNDNGIL